MNRFRKTAAAIVAALAAGYSAQSFAGADEVTSRSSYVNDAGQVVHCVSTDSGRTYCGVPHSRYVIAGTPAAECVQGSTWGFDDRGVWVSGGCRADFNVVADNTVTGHSSYVNADGRVVHCVSTESGRTYCGMPHMRYSISNNPGPACVEGSTWGTDERGVWVSGGCAADFAAATDNARTEKVTTTTTVTTRTYASDANRPIHCVSGESGRTYCGTAHTHYVVRGTPDPVCVEGDTWGTDDRGVWVSDGCAADFVVDEDNR
jgi:Protein of unknown function (DUF3011)